MSVYMTEDEQLDAIKKWWQRYGNIISFIILIILLGMGIYRYYNWHHSKIKQQASTIYEKMMGEFSNKNTKAVLSYANELIQNYDHSIYANLAHITLAKIYVAEDRLDKAKQELQLVVNQTKMSALKQIAKIRIARILAANKAYQDALNELSTVEDKSYLPVINELKGDIYGAKGQYQEALTAYRLAMIEVKKRGMGNLLLEMKTNETMVKSQSKKSFDKIQSA